MKFQILIKHFYTLKVIDYQPFTLPDILQNQINVKILTVKS